MEAVKYDPGRFEPVAQMRRLENIDCSPYTFKKSYKTIPIPVLFRLPSSPETLLSDEIERIRQSIPFEVEDEDVAQLLDIDASRKRLDMKLAEQTLLEAGVVAKPPKPVKRVNKPVKAVSPMPSSDFEQEEPQMNEEKKNNPQVVAKKKKTYTTEPTDQNPSKTQAETELHPQREQEGKAKNKNKIGDKNKIVKKNDERNDLEVLNSRTSSRQSGFSGRNMRATPLIWSARSTPTTSKDARRHSDDSVVHGATVRRGDVMGEERVGREGGEVEDSDCTLLDVQIEETQESLLDRLRKQRQRERQRQIDKQTAQQIINNLHEQTYRDAAKQMHSATNRQTQSAQYPSRRSASSDRRLTNHRKYSNSSDEHYSDSKSRSRSSVSPMRRGSAQGRVTSYGAKPISQLLSELSVKERESVLAAVKEELRSYRL